MFDMPAAILDLQNLSFHYGARQILYACNLQLYPSECLAIVGASGSGKSTLLSVLAGREDLPSTARYHLAGKEIRGEASKFCLRKFTGYVSQNALSQLNFNMSVASNIAQTLFDLGRRDAKGVLQICFHWLEQLGLAPELAYEPVFRLSGGMQQRVQIAAAMVHQPQVLFLDEPTTGLDTVSQSGLLDILRRLKRDSSTSILLVTHDLAAARLIADRVLVLDSGRFVEEAVFDRLLNAPQSGAGIELVRAMP